MVFLLILIPFLLAAASSSDETWDRVTRVIDGDTVVLEAIGRARLIGVDTPETVHPQKQVEHFAAARYGPCGVCKPPEPE
jgi:micrococcal nuclease